MAKMIAPQTCDTLPIASIKNKIYMCKINVFLTCFYLLHESVSCLSSDSAASSSNENKLD